MKRDIYKKLLGWKNDVYRKPLILKGARQTGKTYILKEFGRREFEDTAYFNFEEDPGLKEFFEDTLNPAKVLEKLSIYREKTISPNKTLIFFDEIQESPKALTALKYFGEMGDEKYCVASAGSLLGIKVGVSSPFPVGKITTTGKMRHSVKIVANTTTFCKFLFYLCHLFTKQLVITYIIPCAVKGWSITR